MVHLVDEDDVWSASVLRARLAVEGIEASIRAPRPSARPVALPSVWVRSGDLERARSVVLEAQVEEVFLDDEVGMAVDAPPAAGDSPYDDGSFPRAALALVAALAVLLAIAVALLRSVG